MSQETLTCPSCGARVATNNRFCTTCGKPMDLPRFCGQCGAQLEASARFCGKCGSAVSSANTAGGAAPVPPPASTTAPAPSLANTAGPQAAPSVEPVLGVIASAQKRKGLLGYQLFDIVITRDRLIFALVTDKMQKDAAVELNARAKAEGKGMLGRIAAQFGHLHLVAQRHAAMPLAALLSENKENFFIPIGTISKVRIEQDTDPDDAGSRDKIKIEAVSGKFEFLLGYGQADQARKVLRTAIGAAVR